MSSPAVKRYTESYQEFEENDFSLFDLDELDELDDEELLDYYDSLDY
ncbi:MAG: hypothetical protein OQK68_01615 [Sedimenticola sp.]|nr:hypothetical protein [Sedimenticola sp.]